MGDVTSAALFPKKERAVFVLLSKDDGILCGLGPFGHVFELLDGKAELEAYFKDGDILKRGEVVARVRADLRSVLAGERTALNLLSISRASRPRRVYSSRRPRESPPYSTRGRPSPGSGRSRNTPSPAAAAAITAWASTT